MIKKVPINWKKDDYMRDTSDDIRERCMLGPIFKERRRCQHNNREKKET